MQGRQPGELILPPGITGKQKSQAERDHQRNVQGWELTEVKQVVISAMKRIKGLENYSQQIGNVLLDKGVVTREDLKKYGIVTIWYDDKCMEIQKKNLKCEHITEQGCPKGCKNKQEKKDDKEN